MTKRPVILFSAAGFFGVIAVKNRYEIKPDNVKIMGRTLRIDGTTWLGYSASGVSFYTYAREVSVQLQAISESGDPSQTAVIGIVLNDDYDRIRKIAVRRGKAEYPVCVNFSGGAVKVALFKLSEVWNDKVGIVCIYADEDIVPVEPSKRKILFIGDSITAGYGIEVSEGPGMADAYTFRTMDVNPLKNYAGQTARRLGADFTNLCWSGNGVISQYIPPDTDIPDTKDLLPDLYPYTDRTTEQVVRILLSAKGSRRAVLNSDAAPGAKDGLTVFNPADFVPDVIVAALGTNDASFTKGIKRRERLFAERYAAFMMALGRDYPRAVRLIIHGIIESSLTDACRAAAQYAGAYFMEIPPLRPEEGYGGGGHPSYLAHCRIADQLTDEICRRTGWTEEKED